MRIAAAVILYYPDQLTINNIASYSSGVNTLYIIDNSERPLAELTDALKEIHNACYIHDGLNKGIANRLNEVCILAIKDNFDWLLTMDQDSCFKNDDFAKYLSCIDGLNDKEKIAMTGVAIDKKEFTETACRFESRLTLITSGSILNLALYNKIGAFDNALFIDQVDLEYCYRANLKGYKVICFTNIFLEHSLGITSDHISLKSFRITKRALHSPIRLYYMVRNYLYMQKKYKKSFAADVKKRKGDLLVRIKNNLLYGDQKFLLVKMIIEGFIDYRENRMGKKGDYQINN